MDKKYKKPQIENRLKDRGDDTRKNIRIDYYTEKPRRKPIENGNRTNTKLNFHEQGDSVRKSKAGDKIKQEKRITDQTKKCERTFTKPVLNKKEIYKPKSPEKYLFRYSSNFDEIRNNEFEKRRLLREKYTFRLNNSSSPNFSEPGENYTPNTKNPDYTKFVERFSKKQCNSSFYQMTGTSNDSDISECTKTDKETEKRDNVLRKPIIKTITSKNDTARIYKAVTFVDENKNPPKPLKINMVNIVKRSSRIPRLVEVKVSDSKIETRQYDHAITSRKKKIKRLKRQSSPDSTKEPSPPLTEVARWVPASVNPHTQPYYDAWVSTTLAAISRNSKKDKLFLQKENLLRTFQKLIDDDRPSSTELTYNGLTDERYAGRITVHQRQASSEESALTTQS